MNSRPPSNNSNRDLIRYASMGTQMLIAIGLAVFIGLKLDGLLKLSFPLLVWLLPLLVLSGLIYQFIKETSKRKNDEPK